MTDNESEPKCQTSSRVLTDTQGLEVVLGVGDRWTVTSAIPTAADQTSVTSEGKTPEYQTLFWTGTTGRQAPEVISLALLSCLSSIKLNRLIQNIRSSFFSFQNKGLFSGSTEY